MEEKTLLFGKYDLSEVTVEDPGLAKYMDISGSFRIRRLSTGRVRSS